MTRKASTRCLLLITLFVAALACGGGEAESATSRIVDEQSLAAERSDASRIVACDLITAAELEAMLGSISHGPDGDESAFGSMNVSGCTFFGTSGMVSLRTWHPFSSRESTSAAWAARVRSERGQAEADTGPSDVQALGDITPYEGLGVPAALEDSRAHLGVVTLHTMKQGRGGVYLLVTAPDPDIARSVTEKALTRIP